MRESHIERTVSQHAHKAGWLGIKIQAVNFRGLPDHLYIKAGRCVFVEFKAPGKDPRPLQSLIHDILMERGAEVHIIDNIEAGKELLK